MVSSRVHGHRATPQPLDPQPVHILEFKDCWKLGVVAHAFNPSTWELETGDHCEFKARLVYILKLYSVMPF